MDTYNLNRFIKAQEGVFPIALRELQEGRKRSHWMWFVFPQVHGLGKSEMAQKFAISSLYEAYAFMNNALTRDRLWEVTRVMNDINYGRDIENVLGHVDAMKFKSCMTLFDLVEPESEFDRALRYFFDGERDKKTLKILADEIKEYSFDPFKEYGFYHSGKTLFDDGSHEGQKLGHNVRLATMLDFRKRGCSIATMARKYLIDHRDLFDNYRTSNLEFTLRNVGDELFNLALSEFDNGKQLMQSMRLISDFPYDYFDMNEHYDWETFAFRLDLLMDYVFADKDLALFADKLITEHSALTK